MNISGHEPPGRDDGNSSPDLYSPVQLEFKVCRTLQPQKVHVFVNPMNLSFGRLQKIRYYSCQAVGKRTT